MNSCRRNSHVDNPILYLADSLMQLHPDSALHLIEGIASPQVMNKADRALYALLLTQARYKNYILLENDSLIRVAVDYYEDSNQKELLARSYFYMGCFYRDRMKLPASIEFYLKSLRMMPDKCDSVFLSMIYYHLGDCYSEQGMDLKAREMYRDGYALNMSNRDSLRAFHNLKRNGMTLGSFININDEDKMPRDEKGRFAPEQDQLYMHEYGHYLQSQEYGWGFLVSVGTRSIMSAMNSKSIPDVEHTTHSEKWYEIDASRRGKEYFQKYYDVSWDEDKNPTHKQTNSNFKY